MGDLPPSVRRSHRLWPSPVQQPAPAVGGDHRRHVHPGGTGGGDYGRLPAIGGRDHRLPGDRRPLDPGGTRPVSEDQAQRSGGGGGGEGAGMICRRGLHPPKVSAASRPFRMTGFSPR